jgi:hypothetical protein
LQGLTAAAADAEALAEVLGDEDLGDFSVRVLHNEPHFQVAYRVEDLLSPAGASDLVLLQFRCHGLKNESGELFLTATNTKTNRLEATAVKAPWVQLLMRRSKAKRRSCCWTAAAAGPSTMASCRGRTQRCISLTRLTNMTWVAAAATESSPPRPPRSTP